VEFEIDGAFYIPRWSSTATGLLQKPINSADVGRATIARYICVHIFLKVEKALHRKRCTLSNSLFQHASSSVTTSISIKSTQLSSGAT
jgi:hypothetical protein